MKAFTVTPEDRVMLARYFAVTATGDNNATCQELVERLEQPGMDEMPMLQFAAFIREQLGDLLDDIEADFGFDYGIDQGTLSLVKLRRMIGGEPNNNMKYAHEEFVE